MTTTSPQAVEHTIPGIECIVVQPQSPNQDMSQFHPLVLHLPNGQVVNMWLGDCRQIQVVYPAPKQAEK